MKQAADRFGKILFFSLASCCLFFSGSCGLEEVVVVDEPTVTYNDPLYTGTDYTNFYFEFQTKEEDNQDTFIGTEVYYKIYNNSSTLVSERSSINAVNTSSSSTSAATRMIETYSYQVLGTNPQSSDSVFIPDAGENRRVYIRLLDYGDGDDLKADIKIEKTSIGRIPYRYSNDKSFDLFDNDDSDSSDKIDVEPESGDLDYKQSSTTSVSGEYYVQLFAVGVAFDLSTLTRSYSLLLDLGSIRIKTDEGYIPS